MLVVTLIAFMVGCLAHHLGLAEAIAKIVLKVAKCAKCLVFWLVLISLCYYHYSLLYAIGVALLCSYLSHWIGIGLMRLNQKYNELWQRVNQSKR